MYVTKKYMEEENTKCQIKCYFLNFGIKSWKFLHFSMLIYNTCKYNVRYVQKIYLAYFLTIKQLVSVYFKNVYNLILFIFQNCVP